MKVVERIVKRIVSEKVYIDAMQLGFMLVVSSESLEVVRKFCYLGDMISPGDGVEESTVTGFRCGWI